MLLFRTLKQVSNGFLIFVSALCSLSALSANQPHIDFESDSLDDLLDGSTGQFETNPSDIALNSIKGFIELKPRIFTNERATSENNQQLLINSELEFDLSLGRTITAYFRPRLLVDVSDNDLYRIEPLEAYLSYKKSNWDVRVGQFVENWGIADTFNPIDVLNRRDNGANLLDPERLGEAGLRVRAFLGAGETLGEPTLSLYYLPWFRETRFSPDSHRLGIGSNNTPFYERRGFEPSGSDDAFYALRLQGTLNTPFLNGDLQVILSDGPDRNPQLIMNEGANLVPAYFGNKVLGAGIRAVPDSSALGQFLASSVLKMEAVYNQPYQFQYSPIGVPDDYFSYVVGFDYDIYNLANKRDQLTLTLEFAGESGVTPAQQENFIRPFGKDIISRIFWQAGNFARSSFEFRGVYDFETHERILEATYSTTLLKLHKDLKLELSALHTDFSESKTTSFSGLSDNTSIEVSLRFDF